MNVTFSGIEPSFSSFESTVAPSTLTRSRPCSSSTAPKLACRASGFTNPRRPHRSLPHRATPAGLYDTMPKATPGPWTDTETHDRVRADTVSKAGNVTLRIGSRMHHIRLGRTYARTCVLLLVQDLDVRVVNATTGELLRELTIDP
jgi:hypothetical protein